MYETYQLAWTNVLDRCRAIVSDGDYVALAKTYVNRYHKETLAYRAWPWRNKRGTLVTAPPYTTGTVSITQNSGTITGVGTTFTAGHVGSYIKVGSSADLHLVTTYNSATSLVVDPLVALETASTQTFKLFQLGYALPSDFRLPDEVSNFTTDPPMQFVGAREFRRLMARPVFDIPTHWTLLWSQSGSVPTPSMAVYPFSQTYRHIHFDYQMAVTDLSDPNDVIQLPDEYRAIPVDMAMAKMYLEVFDDEARHNSEMAAAIRLRNQMADDYGFFDDQPQMVPHNYRGGGMSSDDASVLRTVWSGR